MAVIGRQRMYSYLLAFEVWSPSFRDMLRRANRRAVAGTVRLLAMACSWAMWFQTVTLVRGCRHTSVIWVWSAVRSGRPLLFRSTPAWSASDAPTTFTSLRSLAYSAVSRAGNAPGRNWELLSIANGSMNGTLTLAAGAKFGGVS